MVKYVIIIIVAAIIGIATCHVDGPGLRALLLHNVEAGGTITPERQVAELMLKYHEIRCTPVDVVDYVCSTREMYYSVDNGEARFIVGGEYEH